MLNVNTSSSNVRIALTPSVQKSICGVRLPDFKNLEICTKTPPAMSEDEYRQAIIDCATRDGKNPPPDGYSKEAKLLRNSFISCVSPDRKSAITNGLKKLEKQAKRLTSGTRMITLMDRWFGNTNMNYSRNSKGNVVTKSANIFLNGQKTANYTDGEWYCYPTVGEKKRSDEFVKLYGAAFKASYNETAATLENKKLNLTI